jgi:hypothetical protein
MYYVYALIDPRDNTIFYVGKGQKDRASVHTKLVKLGKPSENPYKDNVIKNILNEGLEPIIDYVLHTSNEADAYKLEEDLIKQYGRRKYDEGGILTNLCENATPPHGEYSLERRQKYRDRMIGNKINTGRIQSTEEKIQRSNTLKQAYSSGELVVTDEKRELLSKIHKGKVVSVETRKKQSIIATEQRKEVKGKSYAEIYGPEKANAIKAKLALNPPPNRRPVEINGISYESIKAAARALGLSDYKVLKLLGSQK